MLLLLIALAVVAAKRGWKHWVWLPIGCWLLGCMFYGANIVAAHGTIGPEETLYLDTADIIVAVVLGLMALVGYKPQPAPPVAAADETQGISQTE